MAQDLPTRFREQVERNALLRREGALVVGVSGRSDSVALLHLLHGLTPEWRLRLVAAHVQPDESPRAREDAAFVRQLAESLGVEFDHFVAEAGDARRLTYDARLEYFDHVAKRTKAVTIATGETADDLAEQLLEALVTGAPIAPFSTFTVQRSTPWLQPLTSFTHDECVAFLQSRGLPWRQDPEALALADTRQKLRLLVLPLLARQVAPEARTHLASAAHRLAADEQFLEELTTAARAEAGWTEQAALITLDFARWSALPLSLRVRLLAAAVQFVDRNFERSTFHSQLMELDARCRALAPQESCSSAPLKISRENGMLVFESGVAREDRSTAYLATPDP